MPATAAPARRDVPLRLLDSVRIASPCPMRWEDLDGQSDQVRHCSQCNLNVYNVSNMTADEAESLLQSKGERRLCAGFYRRADGTILTRDCPVGLRAVRERLGRLSLRAAALLAFIFTGGYLARAGATADPHLLSASPLDRVRDRLAQWLPLAKVPQQQTWTAGDICIPLSPPVQAPAPSAPAAGG